jgi:hypothetical protein
MTILYATPRSGSTFVAQALASYFTDMSYLGEHFNCRFQGDHWLPLEHSITVEEGKEIVRRRFESLQQSSGKVFLKMFPYDVNLQQEHELLQRADVIFLERRDLQEHYLSFMVSMTSGKFYESEGLQIQPKSLVAHPVHVYDFFRFVSEFRQKRAQYPKALCLHFEDILQSGHIDLSNGDRCTWSALNTQLPSKQNRNAKIDLFANANEVLAWFAQTEKTLAKSSKRQQ